MSLPHRTRGVKVLKAISSPYRLQILNLLFDKGALSYTELMNFLKMTPSRDAGRFAYHLKFLLKADLVEADAEIKKYGLTDLGKMVLDVADRVEKKAFKPRGMLVRTSHFTLEEFDANKIANSLIKEAKDRVRDSTAILSKAGKTVLGEYTLLNVFPRDIADAHVSGAIHMKSLGTWILKPNEVMNDLRFFFQHGLKLDNPLQLSAEPPQSFESALSIVFNVLLHVSKETDETQTCPYFNVFLSPFIKDADPEAIKENLRLFILNVNQHSDETLGLEPTIPKFVAEKAAIGPQGKTCGKYADFAKESLLLASLTLEIFTQESFPKLLLNPK